MEREPEAGREELRVPGGQAGREEDVAGQAAEPDGRAAVAREARDERAPQADPGVRIGDEARDVGAEEGEHEDPELLVPRGEVLRDPPPRLVGRVAEEEPEDDLGGEEEVGGDPARPGDEPDPELGDPLRGRRGDLVGRGDDDEPDDRHEDEQGTPAQPHRRTSGWRMAEAGAARERATRAARRPTTEP